MTGRRPYLAADVRHEDLLDAAGRLFERGGMSAVSMVAIAKEAGVSRALVYQHFPDLATLVLDYFESRADRFFAQSHAETADASPVVNAFRALVALPDVELRGMDMLLSDYPEPEFAATRDNIRERFVERWSAILQPPREHSAARAALWAVVQASVSLAVSVRRGELSEDVALPMWIGMLRSLSEHLPLA